MNKLFILASLLICLKSIDSFAGRGNFFEQNYRGWLWFEQQEQEESAEYSRNSMPTEVQVHQAKLENERFKLELEGLRHLMVRYPDNLGYIRLYKEKEKVMLDNAMLLATNFAMVNFLNPDIADQLRRPQNIYGRNIVKAENEKTAQQTIGSLIDKVELFVFRQEHCAHCSLLEKHLHSFAKKYGFQVEAVSPDNSISNYFKTHNNPAIIKKLALEVMPTVIAVTKDSSQRFELARGAVSIPDLEDKALLLAEFLSKEQKESKE